jgi:hypothetical protein
MAKEKEEKAVAKKTESGVAVATEFFEDAGAGNEQMTADYLTIPYLSILQDMSPAAKKRGEQYVEGAEPGMFINSVSQEIYSGEVGVVVVNCFFQPRYVEWVPRDQGGGWVATYVPGSQPKTLVDPATGRNSNVLESGNNLNMTHYHMCLVLNDDEAQEVVIGMSRSQIKHSLKWNSKFQMLRWRTSEGKKFQPPRFATKWRLSTFLDSNESGEWFNLKIEADGTINLEDAFEKEVYMQARGYSELMKAGAEVAPQEEDTSSQSSSSAPPPSGDGGGGDIPF